MIELTRFQVVRSVLESCSLVGGEVSKTTQDALSFHQLYQFVHCSS